MTSSLVGSEMCIRDSPFAAPPDEEGPHAAAKAKACALLRPKTATMGGAVSYTHLTQPTICSV
eukprot:1980289-Prorocentrum_lima.AAC.1